MEIFEYKKILENQLELLSKESEKSIGIDLVSLSNAMVGIVDLLHSLIEHNCACGKERLFKIEPQNIPSLSQP